MEGFNSRYEIVREIGEGGMATVYLAIDRRSGQKVALKRLLERDDIDESDRRAFRREYRFLRTIDLPGVPRAYEWGEIDSTPYFTMEYVEGDPFGDGPMREGAGWARAAELLARAALRLHAIHQAGVVHRDVKPGNMIVDPDQEVWWIDFGISVSTDGDRPPRNDGTVVGTLPYLPPERLSRGGPRREPRSDVYSLGVVLYELLVGHLPFEGTDEGRTMARIGVLRPSAPHVVASRSVPRSISEVAMRALSKRPAQRYPTARAFAEAIEVALGRGVETTEAA